MSTAFVTLEDVIAAEAFPDVDLSLRRGRHVDAGDGDWYTFLMDAQALLEGFYARYGCELIHKSDGYFYLLPTDERLGRRHLSSGEMLVGQALTLLYLDPKAVEHGGVVTREQVLAELAGALGTESFLRAMNPKRKRYDARIAEETARAKVGEALRRLAALGFIAMGDDATMRMRPALMRFAEPVRGGTEPAKALARLVEEGELVLTDESQGAAAERRAGETDGETDADADGDGVDDGDRDHADDADDAEETE
jgi:chromosome partition protein MukE